MLKINYCANIENETNVNALFTAVAYEKFDMSIDLTKKAIEDQKKVLDSNEKTENEKAVAREKIATLEKELKTFESELEKVKEVHDNVVNTIASATKKFDNGETISNDKESVRNVLRLTACGENTRFFTICNLSKCDMMESLYNNFTAVHNPENANEDGMIESEPMTYKECNKLVNNIVYSAFSIPVENEYTKVVKTRLNNKELAMSHEAFHTGIAVSIKKNKKTGNVEHDETTLTACIKKVENKKTGKVDYVGDKFMTNLSKLAFAHICK